MTVMVVKVPYSLHRKSAKRFIYIRPSLTTASPDGHRARTGHTIPLFLLLHPKALTHQARCSSQKPPAAGGPWADRQTCLCGGGLAHAEEQPLLFLLRQPRVSSFLPALLSVWPKILEEDTAAEAVRSQACSGFQKEPGAFWRCEKAQGWAQSQ